MKHFNHLCLFLLLGYSMLAQNHVDVLRYSNETLWGSARYVSMGSAFGALGANASSTSYNPAGIATHTTNELSGSINFSDLESQSMFQHASNKFNKNRTLSIPNINYVNATVFDPEDFGDWNRWNFGLGFNRLDDYNQDIYIEHTFKSSDQNEYSFSEMIEDNANGTAYYDLNSFRESLAFNTYLIDTLGGISSFKSNASFPNTLQSYKSSQAGSKNEFYLSLGAAYQNKLFLGLTIGFPSIDYKEVTTTTESNYNPSPADSTLLRSFNYKTNLSVSGSGINLKLGLIYKLDENLRYGFALHTPTYYELQEDYWASMTSDFVDEEQLRYDESTVGIFDYGIYTPFKMINSLAIIIKKKAVISIDHEYLDYGTSKITSDFYNFTETNKDVKYYYRSTSNLRIGGEFRIHPQLSLRGGYALYGSPFANNLNDASKEYLTLGLGLKVKQYFFDLAHISTLSKENLYIYDGASTASIESNKSQLLFSAGFKF